jgi:hypothetical protein
VVVVLVLVVEVLAVRTVEGQVAVGTQRGCESDESRRGGWGGSSEMQVRRLGYKGAGWVTSSV